jgi:CDP-paratose 2-epimerase
MKAIITGAAGFIGCHVSRRLLDLGWDVIGIDNLSRRGSTINFEWLQKSGRRWSFIHVDVRNENDVESIFRKHTDTALVVHTAAQVAVTTSFVDPRLDFEVNALGTFNILEALRRHCPGAFIIYPSTNKVYGGMENAPIREVNGRYAFKHLPNGATEEQQLDFHSPYGCSKGVADQYIRDYARMYGIKSVVCRQSCIYGTRQLGVEDQGWIAWFLIAALNNMPVTLYGDGKQVRDVLWVDDLVDLYCLLYDNAEKVSGRIFNVGGGADKTLSLHELVEKVPVVTGGKLTVSRADWRPGDQKVYISDISALKRKLGWEPRTGVDDGLRMLTAWLKENITDIRRALKVGL